MKVALNVARREGQSGNVLAELLRGWFGPGAGQPGTAHYVELIQQGERWEMRPVIPAPTPSQERSTGS